MPLVLWNWAKLGSRACYIAFVCNSFAVENLSIESQAAALPKAAVHGRLLLARYSCTMVQIGALEGVLQNNARRARILFCTANAKRTSRAHASSPP